MYVHKKIYTIVSHQIVLNYGYTKYGYTNNTFSIFIFLYPRSQLHQYLSSFILVFYTYRKYVSIFIEKHISILYKSLPVQRDAVPPVACKICRYIVRRRAFFGHVPPEGENPVGWHAPRARCPPWVHTNGNPP